MKYFDPRLERLMSEKGDNSDMSKQPRTSEILALWGDKQNILIEEKTDNAIAELHETDLLNKKLHSFAEVILDSIMDFAPNIKCKIEERKEFYVEEVVQHLPMSLPRFSSETTDKINAVIDNGKKEKDKLSKKFHEISVMLSACDTYEQEMSVLKNYEVIDTDGKLNVSIV